MATINKTTPTTNRQRRAQPRTHEGAPAYSLSSEEQLRRAVLACMLWEKTFYEDGEQIANRILKLVEEVKPEAVYGLAIEARKQMNLRHAPLLLTAALAKQQVGSELVRRLVAEVVSRADELAELPAMLAEINGVPPDRLKEVMDDAVKRGLADAFHKFDAYQLAKYNRKQPVQLRDVLRLTHPEPKSEEQSAMWKQLSEGTLPAPDTWEVALSTGGDKKTEFERLLREDKLGYLALLRNLRNMDNAGVDRGMIREAIGQYKRAARVLPFRFVAAAKQVPRYEAALDEALKHQISQQDPLKGETIVLVDVSASMGFGALSRKSDMTAMDAAATLASVVPAENLRVFTFSVDVVEVPPRKGMAGVDAVVKSQPHSGTKLGAAVQMMNRYDYDRLIVITDEQSADRVPGPKGKGYMINVASYANGVGYGAWVHINGFSEAVIKYIQAIEAENLA